MSRRSLTLLIASVGAVAAIAVSVLVPVPYVILGPGPTLNTLGRDSSGQPLITVSGHASYPTSGHLNMVTVSYQGGPGSNLNIFTALAAWLNYRAHCERYSVKRTYSHGELAALLSARGLDVISHRYQFRSRWAQRMYLGLSAYGVLKAGDVITAVDGRPVTCQSSLTGLISAHPAGSTLAVTIDRSGRTEQVQVGTRLSAGHTVMGVRIQEQYKFPFNVKFSVSDIGGPSAGMMFALGIIDKLTPLNLTGGKFIAGTGEITASGQVQAIGGIQQKMVGARDVGATIFLTPASNCADTKGAVPAGLRLVKVSTLAEAVNDLEALKAGQPVRSC